MVFKCQEDSFLKEFSAKVITCTKAKVSTNYEGKKQVLEGYNVILEDTILFPEGGGQPHDLGWLDDKQVIQVTRSGKDAVHFTLEPLTEGSVVSQKIDWERRFDHMQQHSGQHLLSAILENEHNLKTTSWWLGEDECYIELDCTFISNDTIKEVEKRCNGLIREAVPVTVKVCDVNDPDLNEAHTRGLPKDHIGKVRIIKINEIDENLCCGTHVSNLSHLQIIKLLRTERGKKEKTYLHFIVGQRVVNEFQQKLDREQALTALLKNDPSKHQDLVEKLQKSLKVANKNLQNILTEIGNVEAEKIKNANPKMKYFCLYKKEADSDFMRTICRNLENEPVFLLLATGGDDKCFDGNILIQGAEDDIKLLAPRICELLGGKGAGKKNKYQAKVTKLNVFQSCVKLVQDHFQ